jgi:hypothetical protein
MTTFERAYRAYDPEFRRQLTRVVVTAIGEASIVDDTPVMALRVCETIDTLVDVLVSVMMLSEHFDASKLREAAEALVKRVRREVARGRAEGMADVWGGGNVRQRKAAAKELGVTAKAVDDEVKARREDAQVAPLYGHWIVEPWPEPVEGGSLLRDINLGEPWVLLQDTTKIKTAKDVKPE